MSAKYGKGLDNVGGKRISSLIGGKPAFVKEVVDLDADPGAGEAGGEKNEDAGVVTPPPTAASSAPEEKGKSEPLTGAQEPVQEKHPSSTSEEGEKVGVFPKYPFFHPKETTLFPVPKTYDHMTAYNFKLPLSLKKTVDKHSKLVGASNPSEWVRDAILYKLSMEQEFLAKNGVVIRFDPSEED